MTLIRVAYAGLLLCVGCDSKIDVVTEQIAQIRRPSHLKNQPQAMAVSFPAVPKFDYVAQDLRNPFMPSSLANQIRTLPNQARPALSSGRRLQRLEQFALEHLQFKGSIRGADAEFIGLIQTPEGRIERVRLGEYLGLHQGKIIKMSATKIDLIEVIPDGQRGVVKRQRSMLLLPNNPKHQQ